MVILIAAASENNALGKNNDLPWHLPDDFKRFKKLTSGHYIIMGRKTFESLTGILPNRTHVVITRQKNYNPEGCVVVGSLTEALTVVPLSQDVYIIGGGEIFKLAMPLADKIELTLVHAILDADAFFPEIDLALWALESQTFHPKDEQHAYDFTYQAFVRREASSALPIG